MREYLCSYSHDLKMKTVVSLRVYRLNLSMIRSRLLLLCELCVQ